jgi:hypothetical protein
MVHLVIIDNSGCCFLVRTRKLFCGKDSSENEAYTMSGKIIQEIKSIDRNAEEMAESVLRNPLLRTRLGKGSEALEERLLDLADELEKIDPAAYAAVADQVSDALLDLEFVQTETDMVSLRLGQIMEQRSEDRDLTKDTIAEKEEPVAGPGMYGPNNSEQNVGESLIEVLDTLKKC